ncbi:hypothetical protein E3U55_11375 [Filobacillus milosensis]|uniref:DUF4097 domain-containing protein n=1 Tax=Filobacillus milosensis TaxID=94137 RepID=A0A4Y8IM55_9BACI|nr:DUF4097 family beta strand repeat-containing protein [Filobacillus milosensis]TFB18866.1 hypothetical protein E3U55_11375 [Filobacillus milosensis]
MKKIAIIAAIVLVVSFIGLAITVSVSGESLKETFMGQTETVEDSKTFNGDEIKHIEVDISSAEVNVMRTEESNITVEYYGKFNKIYQNQFKVEKNGDELQVEKKFSPSFFIFNFGTEAKIDIFLPDQEFQSFEVDVSAGKLDLQDLKVKDLEIDTSAGKVELASAETEQTSIDTSAGEVIVDGITGDLDIDTSAGRVEVNLEQLAQHINVDTSAGEVIINTSEKPTDLTLDYSASAGSGKIDFPLDSYQENSHNRIRGIVGDGTYRVDVSTSAGSFEFNVD